MESKQILVVDDYPDAAVVVCTLLGILGHRATPVTTGREAVAKASETEFEIAIVDIGLPDLSGYEVARLLRAMPGGPAMYLAAVSGWGQPEDRIRALAAGFDHHQLKPVDATALRRILALASDRLAR